VTTLNGLITQISDDINRTDQTANVSTAILRAVEHYSTHRWWFNEGRAKIGTTPDEERLPLPSSADSGEVIEVDSILININNNSYRLKSTSKLEMDDLHTPGAVYTGRPERYSLYDSQIRLYPIPDATYSVTISYQYVLPELTASSSTAWTNEMGQLIRFHAVADIYANKLHNMERYQMAKVQETEEFTKLRKRANKYQNVGTIRPFL
jgi:hypothetical protein